MEDRKKRPALGQDWGQKRGVRSDTAPQSIKLLYPFGFFSQ